MFGMEEKVQFYIIFLSQYYVKMCQNPQNN